MKKDIGRDLLLWYVVVYLIYVIAKKSFNSTGAYNKLPT